MKWEIKDKISNELREKFSEINPLVLQLLYNRQLVDNKEIESFFTPNYDRDLLDPFLFKDMEVAVRRIFEAVEHHQKIMIYGDYDADGVCSTAILYLTLKGLGADVDIYIPFREGEGYGLNKKVVQSIISQKFDLLITVDCGVANHEEIDELQLSGIDVIVTDHHKEPLQLPKPLALINPHVSSCGYPQSDLCGAGVAFKLAQAVIRWQDKNDTPLKLPVGFEKWLLDLVAIATVGDIVALIGENRVLVKYGLLVLEKTKNIGLKKLIETINNRTGKLDTEYLGWRLVPRINAAGRVDHASAAFYLLTSETEADAEKWVKMLEDNNRFRQQLTVKIMSEAEAQIVDETSVAIIVVGDGWPAGILGLVAGRLADKYHKPTLVFSQDDDPKVFDGASKYVASGRSIAEFDITSALKQCDDLLLRYGGHPQACGLTIVGEENFAEFKIKFSALAEAGLRGVELVPSISIEAELKLSDLTWELLESLEKFEPFGQGNAQPIFCAKNLSVEKVQTVGADGKHLKVLVSQEGDLNNLHKLIGFSFGDWCAKLKSGDKIDIVFELGVNEWNGNKEMQLKIEDLRLSE